MSGKKKDQEEYGKFLMQKCPILQHYVIRAFKLEQVIYLLADFYQEFDLICLKRLPIAILLYLHIWKCIAMQHKYLGLALNLHWLANPVIEVGYVDLYIDHFFSLQVLIVHSYYF